MNGILITTRNEVRPVMLTPPTLDSMQKFVGGYIEHVRPANLKPPYCMIVNEEGLLQGLPVNLLGSFLYGSHVHGNPIVGDILILKDGVNDHGEYDLVGLDNSEIITLSNELRIMIDILNNTLKGKLFK